MLFIRPCFWICHLCQMNSDLGKSLQQTLCEGHFGVEDIIDILNSYFSAMLTRFEAEAES